MQLRGKYHQQEGFVKKRQAIIDSATRLFGSIGFDATTTLELANEAGVTEPLIYYHFKGKNELFTLSLESAFKEYFFRLDELNNNTSTEFQKIVNLINLHFKIVDDLPEQMRLIVTTCPAKLYDPNGICLKNIKKARKFVLDYICRCLNAGIKNGEFHKQPVSATTNVLVALLNGLVRQRVYQSGESKGIKDAAIDFCQRSLTDG
jgi:AcrR family transcriptional regulator